MKFRVKNLGPLVDAAIELGDFTVVCGRNNCGKTYLAYTLDTFLDTIEYNINLPFRDDDLETLFTKGAVVIDLKTYAEAYRRILEKTLPDFTSTLSRFLAMSDDRFGDTVVDVPLTIQDIVESLENGSPNNSGFIEEEVMITRTASLSIKRAYISSKAIVTLINLSEELPPRKLVKTVAARKLAHLFNSALDHPLFPKSFIITNERTGASLFRNELMAVKVRKDRDSNAKQIPTGYRGYGYQRPVEKDIEFILELKKIINRKSYIALEHPEILDYFSMIAGGAYTLDESADQIKFRPVNATFSLGLAESSSTVRALAEMHFYLKHKAKRGQMLMLDEPEINLHPENQRRLARLLAMLVKIGMKVFITTHSDYIIRELNALVRIGLLAENDRKIIADKYGYLKGESLLPSDLRFFVLHDGRSDEILFDEGTRSFGIPSFDDTIEQFNSLYNDIVGLN